MLKVLIVEDDADIAALHAHFIRQDARFSAISLAADLAKARELVEIAAFDLVIVDNYLPDGLGVEFIRELLVREKKPECILVTAANDAETVQKALRYGAFDYLIKPLDYRRLEESLNKFCSLKKQWVTEKAFDQKALDTLFSGGVSPKKRESTDDFTLRQIIDQFTHAHVELTVTAIAEAFGMSKSTARRYLDRAVEQGELVAFLEHGKVGRPTRVYRRPALHEMSSL